MTQSVETELRRWTREEFYQILDLGLFAEQRVELIDGEIISMAAQKNLHAAGVELAADLLRRAFGTGYWVRVQASLDLSPRSVPDPDVAVIVGSPRAPTADNPTTALLIVEVSETTLAFDRNRKASLYAAAGIADYWIVNLVNGCLEVRRQPVSDPTQPLGFGYASLITLQPADHVTPLAAPQAVIPVADLLP